MTLRTMAVHLTPVSPFLRDAKEKPPETGRPLVSAASLAADALT